MNPKYAAIGMAHLAAGLLAAQAAPNFIVILGEGHGWNSTSVLMDPAVPASRSASVRTPNLEKLAESGMRLANFYAASPRCTPTRAAVLTGKSPAQLHMTFVGEGKQDSGTAAAGRVRPPVCSTELPLSEVTLAEVLQRAGYATAHFGKWHLGRVSPDRHGFDESDGPTNNGGPDNVANPHPQQLYRMTERGLAFMARQVQAHKPFYLQLSHYASRQGGEASPEALAAVRSWGLRLTERELSTAAADYDLDLAFGKILRQLEALGIEQNTYVLFTTDHGTPGRNPPLAGGKGTIGEGGVRVPFLIRGPGIPAGACSRVRAMDQDLFPTILALAGCQEPLPSGVEGGSLVGVLTSGGQAVTRAREELVIHFPHYDKDELGPASAVLLGSYKLIRLYETGELRLYNIDRDPGERRNLAQEMPDKVQELNQRLSDYLAAVHAQMPETNATPAAAAPAGGRAGKRKARQ